MKITPYTIQCTKMQWNLHKTDTTGEQPFGRYREGGLLIASYVCSLSHFLLQMNLWDLLTASLAHTSFEKAVGSTIKLYS